MPLPPLRDPEGCTCSSWRTLTAHLLQTPEHLCTVCFPTCPAIKVKHIINMESTDTMDHPSFIELIEFYLNAAKIHGMFDDVMVIVQP